MTALGPIAAELFRRGRARSTWVLVVLPALVGVARIVGGRVADRVATSRHALDAGAAHAATEASGFGPLADGLVTGGAVLALLVMIVAALELVRDRESGQLSIAFLAAPRESVVLAKLVSVAAFLAVGFLLLFAASTGAAMATFGLSAVVEDGAEMASAAELWRETLFGAAAVLPALLTAGAFGLCVSAFASTTGAAVAGTLVPFVMIALLGGLVPDLAGRVFVSYVPFIGDGSTLARLTDIARAYSDAEWLDLPRRATLWPLAQAVAFVLVAILVTRRRPG